VHSNDFSFECGRIFVSDRVADGKFFLCGFDFFCGGFNVFDVSFLVSDSVINGLGGLSLHLQDI